MNQFEYARPTTIQEAVALLSDKFDEVAPLAGGTDLLSLMKDFVVQPKRLVSLMALKDAKDHPLQGIRALGGVLTIGATTTLDELLANPIVQSQWTALWQAADGIRSPQLRAMGTVGGELLQRPRCWYFRHQIVPNVLSLDANGRDVVTSGDHRYHAIFDNQRAAKFVSPSSLAPALIALGATVEIAGPSGERKAPVSALYRSAAEMEADGREFTLAPNELVTRIVLPASDPNLKSATYEVRPRQGLDWPLATASVALTNEGGKTKALVVLGHVAPRPWIAEGASKVLEGQELNATTIAAAAAAAVAGATPLKNNGYKVELAKVAAKRALLLAAGMKF